MSAAKLTGYCPMCDNDADATEAERRAQYMCYLESLPYSAVANAPTMAEYFSDAPTETAILPRMSRTVYRHPDGFALTFDDHTLIATDDDGNTVSLPIGPLGLVELGNDLLALAAEQEEELISERAGAGMGFDLIDELFALRGKPQAEAFRAIHAKLYALSKLEHFDSAAGGFTGAVVNVLEIGIANLPKFKGGEQ